MAVFVISDVGAVRRKIEDIASFGERLFSFPGRQVRDIEVEEGFAVERALQLIRRPVDTDGKLLLGCRLNDFNRVVG